MNTRFFYVILAVLPLIIISGCLGGGNVNFDTNNGLVINEFFIDPPVAEVDDVVRAYLDIENVGGTTAECITAELFGVESWYDIYGQPMSYSRPWAERGMGFNYYGDGMQFSYWDYNKGFINVGYDKYAGVGLQAFIGNSWGQFSTDFCSSFSRLSLYEQNIKYWDIMTPPDLERNKPGQSFTTQWEMLPPELPEGVSAPYPITARVSYLYTSAAHMNIKAFNKDQYKVITDSGQTIVNPMVIQNSHASPIQVVVTRATSPIVVNDRMPGIELVPYTIELQNVGDGWPMSVQGLPESGFMFATVTLNGPGVFFYDCLGYTTGQEIFLQGEVIQNLIKLRSDRRAPFGCTLGIDRAQWIDKPMGTISMTFEIYYRYYIDAETEIIVKGVERFY